MGQQRNNASRVSGSLMAVALACLSPFSVLADTTTEPAVPLFDYSDGAEESQPLALLPIQKEQSKSNLAFDLGGSESRKLELQLSEPITLNINNNQLMPSTGVGSVFLDSNLSFQLMDDLDITSSLGAGRSQSSFRPLGSIHCQNGVLDHGSFRASDCYFINQANVLKQDQVALGLRYGRKNVSTAVSMFRREASSGQKGVVNYTMPMIAPDLGPGINGPGTTTQLHEW